MTGEWYFQRFGLDAPAEWHGHDIVEEHPALARMAARRTHRHYATTPVTPATINQLLDIAFAAPSKSDFQQATVIRVVDATKRASIAALVPAMPWIGTAPAFLVFCADARRLERIGELRGKRRPNRNLEAFFNASIDAALVLQSFMLAAEHVGLGCCPISAIRNSLDQVSKILALPPAVVPIAGMTVGYPATGGYISMRLPPVLTRHVDVYADDTFADQLDGYDRRRESRHPTSPLKQRNAAAFGYSDAYGWSEDKARQAMAAEGERFGAMVRASGFDLD
jgi:FMN reductase [NAD(P)H]